MNGTILTCISMFGSVVAFVVSVLLLVWQMRKNQKWNRRKASEEMLAAVITGKFPDLMDRLVVDFDWDISSQESYDALMARLNDPKEIAIADMVLRNIFRHLEVICINMDHKILDEDVCYDYLRSILTTFLNNCKTFIQKERNRRKEIKIFSHTESYARKWLTRTNGEQLYGPKSQQEAQLRCPDGAALGVP